MKKLPLTVILLTLNEEFHLPGALDNLLGWAEDVFVLDSLSTDRTVDIALEHGAKVVQHPFANFGDQWNWALEKLPIRTPWTLKVDPDERLGEELKSQIEAVTCDPNALNGYSFPRRLWFMGKPLHVKADVLRLWRTGRCRFSDVIVNEHPLVEGSIGRLTGVLEHHDSPDLHHWCEKQNRYTTMEAIARVRRHKLAATPRLLGSALERRMLFKQIFFHIPFRYQLYWLYVMIWRGAWKAGRIGLAWAHLRTEIMILRELKAREMRSTGRIPEVPRAPHGKYDPRVVDSEVQKQLMLARQDVTVPRQP